MLFSQPTCKSVLFLHPACKSMLFLQPAYKSVLFLQPAYKSVLFLQSASVELPRCAGCGGTSQRTPPYGESFVVSRNGGYPRQPSTSKSSVTWLEAASWYAERHNLVMFLIQCGTLMKRKGSRVFFIDSIFLLLSDCSKFISLLTN